MLLDFKVSVSCEILLHIWQNSCVSSTNCLLFGFLLKTSLCVFTVDWKNGGLQWREGWREVMWMFNLPVLISQYKVKITYKRQKPITEHWCTIPLDCKADCGVRTTEEKNSFSIPWRKQKFWLQRNFLSTQGIKFLQFHRQEENLRIYHHLHNHYKKLWWNWPRNITYSIFEATADELDRTSINSTFKAIWKSGEEEGISFLLPWEMIAK